MSACHIPEMSQMLTYTEDCALNGVNVIHLVKSM